MADKPFDPRFPPVQPVSDLVPWEQPQTLLRGRNAPFTGRGALAPAGMGGVATSAPSSDAGGLVQWVAMAHQYASMINNVYVAGLASQKIIDAPVSYRNMLAFRNVNAVANIFIQFGSDASQRSVFRLTPNTMILFDAVVPQDDIYVLADLAGQFVSVAYSTIALPEMPVY
ncbi:MAG: hypothetical protein ACOYBQ_10300 [Fluviibacter sp.]